MVCGSAIADVRDVVYGYNETNIFAVNIQTGAATNVFHFAAALTGDAAMAQRPSDGVLFYIDGQSGNDTVFSWDPSNPANPPVNLGRTGAGVPYLLRLAFAADGNLYGIDGPTTVIVRINQTNGVATTNATFTGGANGGGDMVFAPDGTCYMVLSTNLYTVPLAGGPVTTLGPITGIAAGTLTGLAFDEFGRMLACSSGNPSRIYVIDPATRVATALPSTLGEDSGDLCSVPRRVLTGFVYGDTNFNATLDAGESGTGLNLYIKLVATNAPGTAVLVTNVNAVTGGYSLNPVSGVYNLIVSGNATNTDLTPFLPAGWIGTQAPNQVISNVVVGAANLTNDNFGFFHGSVVTLAATATPAISPTNVNATFTITFTNISANLPQTLTDVADTLPAGVSYVGGTSTFNGGGIGDPAVNASIATWTGSFLIPPLQSLTLTFVATVPGIAGIYTNQAVAHIGPLLVDTTVNSTDDVPATATVTITGLADVSLVKTGPAIVLAGSNLTYNIAVSNAGPTAATNVIVKDTLPASAAFVSATGGGVHAGNLVTWPALANFPNGAATNFSVTVTAPPSGLFTNSASATSGTPDPNTSNNDGTGIANNVITKANRAPVAVNDLASTPKNTAVTVAVLGNDSDPDGDPLTITGVSPTNGTAGIVGTNVVFTPAAGFFGTATIGYTISDGNGGTAGALISVSVTNRPPMANGQGVTTVQGAPKAIVLTGSDPDGDPLTFAIVGAPANGTLSLLNTNTGTVTYTPNLSFAGTDSFTFTVNDGTTNSLPATVTVSLTTQADLAVFKTGPASAVAGANLTYTISVTNSGPSTATNVVVTDQLPAGVTLVGATPGFVTVPGNQISWTLASLGRNSQTNFTVTLVSSEGNVFTNVAFASSGTLDPNPANNNGTLTNSQTLTVVTPVADVAVFKTGGASVAPGGTVNYVITATNSGPSTASNVVVRDTLPAGAVFQSASGGFILSNNVVVWPGMTLARGASAAFTVAVTAPGSGSFVNIASSMSDTPDSNTNNNNGSSGGSQVTTSVTPTADVQVFLLGPTNVTVGDGFSYTIVVTNAGPSPAINTLAQDVLPTNLVFGTASGGGVVSNNVVTWPVFPVLASGQATNLVLTVIPVALGSTNLVQTNNANPFNFVETNLSTSTVGFLTNIASAFSATFDPNLTNNTGTLSPLAAVQTVIVPGVFSLVVSTNTYPTNGLEGVITNTIVPIGPNLFIVGTSAFNPQTGLYEEDVTVTNIGTVAVHALRLYVGGLRSGVAIYNATGTNNGVPYVEYDPPASTPLLPGNSVTFLLEFFVSDRQPFTNSLTAVAIIAPPASTVTGSSVPISQFQDLRNSANPRFLIQFGSIPGRTYTVLYSDNLVTWNVAVPSIVASANITQWYDDGPPKTLSKPTSVGSRFYQVILDP
jgi:uncharacterized repeat protein (TIGR01451 family)